MQTFYGGGYMFRNLEAEQRRAGMTNTDVAEYLGVSRATYENKKKDVLRQVRRKARKAVKT